MFKSSKHYSVSEESNIPIIITFFGFGDRVNE